MADAWNALQSAVGGKPFSQIIEGEKTFDLTLRWPERLRQTKEQILEIPVDVSNNVAAGSVGSVPQTALTGSSTELTPLGTSSTMPAVIVVKTTKKSLSGATPRRRIKDLVMPHDEQGHPNPDGGFVHSYMKPFSASRGAA